MPVTRRLERVFFFLQIFALLGNPVPKHFAHLSSSGPSCVAHAAASKTIGSEKFTQIGLRQAQTGSDRLRQELVIKSPFTLFGLAAEHSAYSSTQTTLLCVALAPLLEP